MMTYWIDYQGCGVAHCRVGSDRGGPDVTMARRTQNDDLRYPVVLVHRSTATTWEAVIRRRPPIVPLRLLYWPTELDELRKQSRSRQSVRTGDHHIAVRSNQSTDCASWIAGTGVARGIGFPSIRDGKCTG